MPAWFRLRVFRAFRQKQMLRIGVNDIIRDRPLEEITRDISRVADTSLDEIRREYRRITFGFSAEPPQMDFPGETIGSPLRGKLVTIMS